MKTVAEIICKKMNALGFTKNGKPMVIDQADEVVAALAGCRSAAALRELRKKKGKLKKGEQDFELALTPDHPEECEGTDFIMNEGVDGVWVRVDKMAVHICRGSAPRANDGGLRIMVDRHDSEDLEAINSLVVFPEDLEPESDSDDRDAEYCDKCNNRLEDGQIGLCGDCQDEEEASFTNHYLCVCGHQWEDEWDCEVDDDCPVCGTTMTPYASDDGSMSSEEISKALDEVCFDRKFVVSDRWGHIFSGEHESIVRFVFSREKNAIVAMQIQHVARWVDASRSEMADVEDSLKNANWEFLDNPYDFGDGYVADELRGWAAEAVK